MDDDGVFVTDRETKQRIFSLRFQDNNPFHLANRRRSNSTISMMRIECTSSTTTTTTTSRRRLRLRQDQQPQRNNHKRRIHKKSWVPSRLLLIFVVVVAAALLSLPLVDANVAYPGIWTGRQPNGQTTGTEQLLIGSAEYHYAVVETEDSFFPTVQSVDGMIRYATLGRDGRYLPTNVNVGDEDGVDADHDDRLQDALQEHIHVVHSQCMEQDFCKWKFQQQQQQPSKASITHTSGSIVNLVIPFTFANHKDTRTIRSTQELDQSLFNGPELTVQDYFKKQSYGKLTIVSELTPWVSIPFTEQQCANSQSGLSTSIHTCLQAALQEASQLLEDWDTVFQSVATVTFVHSGYSAEFGGNDPDGTWYENRIWSHAWEFLATTTTEGDDDTTTTTILPYALISDKYDRKNAHVNRVGVAVHELAQVLGAPSLYGPYPGFGLGYYDMLANPWGFDGTLTHCGSMSPYTRHLFGWMDFVEITKTSGGNMYELEHSYSSNQVYMIQQGFPEGEYLILENRQEEGYDKGLSQPGLAIYHIDEHANDIGSHPGDAMYPQNHYKVALLQADGRFDLERMEDEGDSGDLFHAGRFTGFGPNGVFLADGSPAEGGHPNTNTYQGKATGIVISEISVPDKVMTFKVEFT